jgi:hypothetical protein
MFVFDDTSDVFLPFFPVVMTVVAVVGPRLLIKIHYFVGPAIPLVIRPLGACLL